MAGRAKYVHRKNFFAAAVITAVLWIVWAIMFFLVPPEGAMPFVFLLISFLVVLFSGALIFANTRRGLLLSLGVVSFMLLRYFEIGNYLNLVLLAGLLLSVEYYLSRE